MARNFQTLQVTYWDGSLKLTANEKLVELFLMLNRGCECTGLQQMHPGTIAEYTGLSLKSVEESLSKLVSRGRIARHPGDWIIVPGKWEHQQRKIGQAEIAMENSLSTAPTKLQEIFKHYQKNCSCLQDNSKTTTTKVQDGSTLLGSREYTVENRQKLVENKSGKPEPSAKASEFVKELFPDMELSQRKAGALILDEIEKHDKMPLDNLMPALRWARNNVIAVTNKKEWSGWSKNFKSCASLRKRKNGPADDRKWKKIYDQYRDQSGIDNEPSEPPDMMKFNVDDETTWPKE